MITRNQEFIDILPPGVFDSEGINSYRMRDALMAHNPKSDS
jgi:hypothetical protein